MPGLYFEEFTVGQTFQHSITRTITEADNVWFSALTHNPAPLHLDAEYMKNSEFGQRIVNSCLTLFFIKYCAAHPAVTAVTPATSKAKNMLDNIGAAYGELPDEATRRKMEALVESLPAA